jgi:hypothetical protein
VAQAVSPASFSSPVVSRRIILNSLTVATQ